MKKKDTTYFKEKLEKEKALLESELATVGRINPNTQEWEATANESDIDSADENEVADKMEELEDNEGILEKLETQLHEVKSALDRISDETYGICEVCNKEIERDRLEANPSAKKCKTHMKS